MEREITRSAHCQIDGSGLILLGDCGRRRTPSAGLTAEGGETLFSFMELLRQREEGQAMVEYALITSLVSIAAIAILAILGTDVTSLLKPVANALLPGSGD